MLPIFQILQSVLSCIKLCHSLSLYFNVHYKNYIGYTYVMSMSCRVKPVYPLLLFTLYPFSYVLCIISQLFFNLTSKVLFISILHLFQFTNNPCIVKLFDIITLFTQVVSECILFSINFFAIKCNTNR